jgi:hypothetical protein
MDRLRMLREIPKAHRRAAEFSFNLASPELGTPDLLKGLRQ